MKYRVTMFVEGSVVNGGFGPSDAARRCGLGAAAISAVMLGGLLVLASCRPRWSGAAFGLGFAIESHPIILVPLLAVIL